MHGQPRRSRSLAPPTLLMGCCIHTVAAVGDRRRTVAPEVSSHAQAPVAVIEPTAPPDAAKHTVPVP